jgi:hypothetical protein
MSTARVIERQRRQRTVPGRRPVNPPRSATTGAAASGPSTAPPLASPTPVSRGATGLAASGSVAAGRPAASATPVSGVPAPRRSGRPAPGRASLPPPRRRPKVPAHTPAIYRRRRVLAALVMLNASELCGVGLVGPGFWIGSAPSLMLLAAYLVHLRRRAVQDRRKRREAARRAAWIAARQAELRREQARRLAARREALRRAAAARAVAQRESLRLSQRYVDGSARGPLRGRAYEARAAGY